MLEIERKQVAVEDLELGMYVVELDRPWLGTPFLFQGFPITTEAELERLRRCCQYVYIDVAQSRLWSPDEARALRRDYELTWIEPAQDRQATQQEVRFSTQRLNVVPAQRHYPPQNATSLLSHIEAIKQIHSRTREYIGRVLNDVRLGRSINVHGARELVNDMVDAIVLDDNALAWFAQLKRRDEYTSLHSINVCIISLLFGRHLGYSVAQLREIGHGALLHDLGKMRVPLGLLNKPHGLEGAELEELKRHPQYGYELLKEAGGMSVEALEVVYAHHERMDGSGYPRRLKGKEISDFAMLVSVVDVYDAITSDRVYHTGISPHEALNQMYEWAPTSFPKEILEEFIKCLGIYPIGSIVELNTGDVGVVMTVNRTHRLRPVVTLVLDPDKQRYPVHKVVNLELYAEGEDPVNISRILESNAYGIDVPGVILGEHAEVVPA